MVDLVLDAIWQPQPPPQLALAGIFELNLDHLQYV